MRIPKRFEFAEGLDDVGAEHLRQEFALGLAIAVFAGERAAVGDDEVGGFFHVAAEFCDALGGFQAERQAGVDAAVTVMAELGVGVAVFLRELAEVAQVVAEFFRRDGGVFPGRPGFFLAGDAAGADAVLTHFP